MGKYDGSQNSSQLIASWQSDYHGSIYFINSAQCEQDINQRRK